MTSPTKRYEVIESAFAAACVNRNDMVSSPITLIIPGMKVILIAELVNNRINSLCVDATMRTHAMVALLQQIPRV